ncbi:MAG: EAL domain-containing protein [Methylococcales bacterium]|nr:EAL domain-containing protein [Methylococcales bacterium]
MNTAIEMFLQIVPREIGKLRFALESNDAGNLTKFAHSFKLSCANLGVQPLINYARSLEEIGAQGHTKGANDLLAAMESELPSVIAALLDDFARTPAGQAELASNRILLISDTPDFQLVIAEAFRASAFLLDKATNSSQALEHIRHRLPDIVLIDAVTGSLDALQTCRLLKTNPALADTPILILTESGDAATINSIYAAGATDFIVKLIDYPVLIQRLHFILRAGRNTAKLRKSLLQLTDLTAISQMTRLGYWIWNTRNNQFQISVHLANLCGISLEQFDGTLDGFMQLIHPQDRDFVKDIIVAAAYSSSFKCIEYRLQTEQSETIYVHQDIEALSDKNERIITGTVLDVTRKKETGKQFHHRTLFDNLTGLASRTNYHERIEDFIRNARSRNQQFAFLFIDLDDFNEINDKSGHYIGDQFLKAIARRLKLVVREIDFIARLGGDEFCIILANICDDEGVCDVANRCLQKINQPLSLNHHPIIPRASIGIAIFPRDGQNESELIKAAEMAKYSARQAGKQCYVFYSPDMSRQATQRRKNEDMLREAFRKKQFILHYQPQVSISTGRITGVEALVRWQHPEKGIVYPDGFITLTERLGLIVDLGNWVLKTVCEQMSLWHRSGTPLLQIAVNLSPSHFQDPALVNTIRNLMAENNIPAHYLELEVTENAMQTKGHIEVFNQLRELGVKIAIDDFGTGFSCLASLQKLPLDCLKIDKIFVDEMLYNPHTSLLLGTIIGLANALGYTIVAEGVETRDQATAIQELGCNIMQGFLYSPAVPANEIPALINTHLANASC